MKLQNGGWSTKRILQNSSIRPFHIVRNCSCKNLQWRDCDRRSSFQRTGELLVQCTETLDELFRGFPNRPRNFAPSFHHPYQAWGAPFARRHSWRLPWSTIAPHARLSQCVPSCALRRLTIHPEQIGFGENIPFVVSIVASDIIACCSRTCR